MDYKDLVIDLFVNCDRQGSGSIEETLLAFDLAIGRYKKIKVLDIGCGTGLRQ